MRHYVTVCDAGFLPRLKVLHASMLRNCHPFRLHVLPWDDVTDRWTRLATNVDPHPASAARWCAIELPGPYRTQHERMWAARSDLTATLLEDGAASVCQLDADLMFFSSPERDFAAVDAAGAPAGVMPHYFAGASHKLPGVTTETHEIYGRYNSGFVFLRDAALARRWADQTRAWCYFRLEDGKFADQPYLNDWPARGAIAFAPHVAPGPWTSKWFRPIPKGNDVLIREAQLTDTRVGARPLVAWHFSSLKLDPNLNIQQLANAEYAIDPEAMRAIYAPYIAALIEASR